MAYSIPVNEIVDAVESGYYFMKIKIGQPGTQNEMLSKDIERLTAIHKAIGNYSTPHTDSGKLPYYFDANGRYEKKETLLKLIDHAVKIGAYDQIAIIEEPCFCADLTVNPILVDWNKNVAARLDPFPGLGTGLLESNGHQNYKNWNIMESYHPYADANWRKTQKGVFNLDDDFYLKSGGILATCL